MKKLTTEEFKQKYKDALRSFADQMIQSDLNHIWDCCGEQLFEELEELSGSKPDPVTVTK